MVIGGGEEPEGHAHAVGSGADAHPWADLIVEWGLERDVDVSSLLDRLSGGTAASALEPRDPSP